MISQDQVINGFVACTVFDCVFEIFQISNKTIFFKRNEDVH